MRNLATTGLLILLTTLAQAAPAGDTLGRALADELARSMTQLDVEGLDKPYFIAYRVDDLERVETSATFGSLLESQQWRRRRLSVEVRVGSRDLDNTNFLTFSGGSSGVVRGCGSSVELPLEDDYRELRRQIWLATDAAYKSALDRLAKKRAVLENRTRADEIPDFSVETPATISDTPDAAPIDIGAARRLVTALSARAREMPLVSTSRVRLLGRVVRTTFVNSEGASFHRTTPSVILLATARAQAEDGMWLSDFVRVCGRSLGDLPGEKELAARIDAMGRRLEASRSAALPEIYNGPVLFEGQAAAELFAQVFVPSLVALRAPVAESEQMAAMLAERQAASFLDKLGGRVLPRFLNLTNDPRLEQWGGVDLLGRYAVDDDGVASRETQLVRRGILKALLADRSPARRVPASTGSRRGLGPAPGNLVLTADEGLSRDALVREMMALVQERELDHGVIVRRIGDPMASAGEEGASMYFADPFGTQVKTEPLLEVYRVYADGREERLRNVTIAGIAPATFKEIVAVSDQRQVVSLPMQPPVSPVASLGFCGSGEPPQDTAPLVSLVVPSLLFEEITLKKQAGEIPRPPIAPHPFFSLERH